jgi:hypothetical protein
MRFVSLLQLVKHTIMHPFFRGFKSKKKMSTPDLNTSWPELSNFDLMNLQPYCCTLFSRP